MGTPVRALIVEDSADDAELIVRQLELGGFDPAWERVDTPEAMAAAFGRQEWDIVISDYTMPRFSATQALTLARKTGQDLPFIIVSGSIGEETAVQAMKAGAHDYILKGNLAKLAAAVARELKEAGIRRAHAETREMLSETQGRLDTAMRQLVQAEKMTALGDLICGVAHEMNNPLSSIMGYSELLLANGLPPEVQRRVGTIHSEATRMAKIVRNLLTFARKHPPEKQYLDLNEIIERTLELKAYHFRVSQIDVQKDLAPDLPRTMLDGHQIQQVLLNLLNNAEQSICEARRGGVIRLTTRAAGDRIEARVSDDGPGIPRAVQARIFEPFFTTKKEGKGTGLGLSLCYGIVQEHGGTIRAESAPGKGATFIIDLALAREDAATRTERENAPESPIPPLRILVVDDEPNVQALLMELLGSRGHQVDAASDVPDALERIAAAGYDLIISDMKMPHGTGRDIFRAVREKNPRLARRIVFTSGDGASAETRRFFGETGNEIVPKPFKIDDIERAIAGAIRN